MNNAQNIIPRLVTIAANLSLNDLVQLQVELEKLRVYKIRSQQVLQQQQQYNSQPQTALSRATDIFGPVDRQVAVPIDWRTFDSRSTGPNHGAPTDLIPGARGTAHTRIGKKSSNPETGFDANPDYYNPYECGPRQSSLPAQVLRPHTGMYDCDAELLQRMGINSQAPNYIPSHIRNINVESSLIQREATRLPGQREIVDREVDRFETLPFDPQNTSHIIWADSMPRGGYSTRNDRLEYD